MVGYTAAAEPPPVTPLAKPSAAPETLTALTTGKSPAATPDSKANFMLNVVGADTLIEQETGRSSADIYPLPAFIDKPCQAVYEPWGEVY